VIKPRSPAPGGLWTRDFTILTLGTTVSLLGSTMSSFAMDLMILDRTGSTLLFAVYNLLYFAASALSPLLSGPFLDRFSRRKTIYTLDFLTAALFALLALLMALGAFRYALLAAANLLLGGISGVMGVAYESFFPLVVPKGKLRQAYAISSTLETLSMVMLPAATLVYRRFGILPLFAVNALTYLAAAILETRIRAREDYLTSSEPAQRAGLRRFGADFREGLRYLAGEKGLLAITLYFFFSSVTGGMSGVVTLPWFRGRYPNGEYVYMLTWGMSSLARFLGGLLHYRLKLPRRVRFAIALGVYVLTSLLEGVYLFFSLPVMMAMTFLVGILGVTSYNIRLSATQNYVPDGKKGRFNGCFNTLCTLGTLLGEGAAGGLSLALDERRIVVLGCALCAVAALVLMGANRREVAAIYNAELEGEGTPEQV